MNDPGDKRKCDPGQPVDYIPYRKHVHLDSQKDQNRALQALARIFLYNAKVLASGKKWSLLQMLLDGFSENSGTLMDRCEELLKDAGKHDRVNEADNKRMTLTKVAPGNITEDLKTAAHLVKYVPTLSEATHNSCGPVLDRLTWDKKVLLEGGDDFISRIKKALALRTAAETNTSKYAKISTPRICMVSPQLCAPACAVDSSTKPQESAASSAPAKAAVLVQSKKPACAGNVTNDKDKAVEIAQAHTSKQHTLVEEYNALLQTHRVAASNEPKHNIQTPHSQRQPASSPACGKTEIEQGVKKSEECKDPEADPDNVRAWHKNAWHPDVKAKIAQVHKVTNVDVEKLHKKALDLLKSLPCNVAVICLTKRIIETNPIKDESNFIIKNCKHLINQWGVVVASDGDSESSEDDDSDDGDGSNDEGAAEHDGESSGVAASHG